MNDASELNPGVRQRRRRDLDWFVSRMSPYVEGEAQITPEVKRRMVLALVGDWNDQSQYADPLRPEMERAAALLVEDQAVNILPRITRSKKDNKQFELFEPILNEVYSLDGIRKRLGDFTPDQARKWVFGQLEMLEESIRDKRREITKLLKLCTHDDRPIKDQLGKPE